MVGLREFKEHVFTNHFALFKLFLMRWKLQLFKKGNFVVKLYFISFFTLNCYYYLNYLQSAFLELDPFSIKECLPLIKVLISPPVVILDEIYDCN